MGGKKHRKRYQDIAKSGTLSSQDEKNHSKRRLEPCTLQDFRSSCDHQCDSGTQHCFQRRHQWPFLLQCNIIIGFYTDDTTLSIKPRNYGLHFRKLL